MFNYMVMAIIYGRADSEKRFLRKLPDEVETIEDIENLPPPDEIAQEIADNLESALDSVNELVVRLGKK